MTSTVLVTDAATNAANSSQGMTLLVATDACNDSFGTDRTSRHGAEDVDSTAKKRSPSGAWYEPVGAPPASAAASAGSWSASTALRLGSLVSAMAPVASMRWMALPASGEMLRRKAPSGVRSMVKPPLSTRVPEAVGNGTANATMGVPVAAEGTTGETVGRPSRAARRCP